MYFRVGRAEATGSGSAPCQVTMTRYLVILVYLVPAPTLAIMHGSGLKLQESQTVGSNPPCLKKIFNILKQYSRLDETLGVALLIKKGLI